VADETFTKEQVETLVQEKLAAAKAEGDKAFQQLWDEAKAAKAKAKAFEGIDPDEVRTLKQRYQELEQKAKAEKRGITSDELEKMRTEIRADLEKEYVPYKTQAEQLGQRVRTLQLDTVVKGEMAKSGARAERIDALFRLTGDEFDLTEDGKPVVKNRMGISVEKYITDELTKQYPEFFMGSGSSGGGAPKSNGGAGGSARVIAADDPQAFLKNVEKIAKGEVVVR
jgi:hypothetical protein